jgi:SSS family solute:Na+ symporter
MWGFFALAALTDPSFYHRCFAASSTATAQKGILWSTLFWFMLDICTTLGGMYARAVLPHAAPQDAYLSYALDILPSPLGGLFLAGIFATILSATDTYLFVGSTTLFKNLMPTKHRDHAVLKYLGMVFIAGLAAFFAEFFEGSIYQIWKTLGSLSSACLLAPLMIGFFSKQKISDYGFASACIIGVVSLTVWKYIPRSGVWADIDEFYIGLAGSMLSIGAAHFIQRLAQRRALAAGTPLQSPAGSLYSRGGQG